MTAPNATALDVFNCPLAGTQLIEASAGTGKTWNICGLVLRLLLEQRLAVQDILVVTFTNAATAELRERIRSRVVTTLAALRGNSVAAADPFVMPLLHSARQQHGLQDDDMALRLDLALQTFDEASIFTIHGFCQRALADAPFTAGMPMVQTLLEDDRELVLQVATDFWRRHVAGGDIAPELAAHLLDHGDSPARCAALLKRRLAKPLSQLSWPAELDAAPAGAPIDSTALAQAWAHARRLWQQDRDAIVSTVQGALPRLNGRVYKAGSVEIAAHSWDALFTDSSAAPSTTDLPKLDLLGSTRLQPKKNQAPVPPQPFFNAAQAWLDEHAQLRQRLDLARLRLLRELLTWGPQALREAKRERRVQAFDDMLFNLHQRLAAPEGAALARTLRARFPAALIDEFQDTDPLQFAIFSRLYAGTGAPLFLVGDPKQAIYSFRNADLHIYLHARQQTQAQYTLAQNQRSTPALLDALNALFGANPQAFMLAGLDYTAVSSGPKPRAVLVDTTEPRAALQVWTLPESAAGTPLPKADAAQAAAQACAGEIARLLRGGLHGQITLDGHALRAADIAVLVRSHSQGAMARRALAALGVGSVEHSQASVFASADARELEQVLRGVLEPTREPVLRAALATALLGGQAGELHTLANDDAATAAAVQRYVGYRQLWQQRGVGVMLRQWRVAEQVSQRLLARPDGERRLTNLLHLGECLHEASATHRAPEALCRWLQGQRTQGRSDEATQLRLASDRNLVQIVTIHKSKGLEYPFVFCPFLWDGHGGSTGSAGDGLDYHDADGQPVLDMRSLDKTQAQAIKASLALQRAAENLRLVYVALTRAVHRCHLVVGLYASGRGGSTAEARRGPLSWLVAGAGFSPAGWHRKPVTAPALQAAWTALAAAQAPHIAIAPLPAGPHLGVPPQSPAAEQIAALPAPRHIDPGWAIGSYSSLTQGARHEAAALDHDLRLLPGPEGAVATESATESDVDTAVDTAAGLSVELSVQMPLDIAANDILRFPRGAVAGECLHAVFEHIDFTQPATWPGAIGAALAAHPAPWRDPTEAHRGPAMLQGLLAQVLHTPLPGGAVLAQVPPARCLVELEFDLPVPRLGATALAGWLHQHGYASPGLTFGQLRGHLRGFIDLVFEHAGRFYVLDWKSNHLGDTQADYGPAHLARAMDRQGYHLQYLLYCVALHRHLAQRLPGYDHAAHFGGVLYLFVRGVRPHWPGHGVFAHRPTLATLQHLSALLNGDTA
jgi:exodeoxyribonuclease V beta subunit